MKTKKKPRLAFALPMGDIAEKAGAAELKDRIKAEAAKRIEELLEQTDFSMNDLGQLAGVSHGSVKGRAKTLASASDIVTAVLDGVRATGTRKPSTESVKSLLDSMSPEQKQKFLAELGLAQA